MLDPRGRQEVLSIIHRLNREQGTTIVHITHYMEEAAKADYVVILDHGKVAAEGTPLELKNKYTGDFIVLYHPDEEAVKAALGKEAEKAQKTADGWKIAVENTAKATELILAHPEIFKDYEVLKGNMDDVFLSVTGKAMKEEGEAK